MQGYTTVIRRFSLSFVFMGLALRPAVVATSAAVANLAGYVLSIDSLGVSRSCVHRPATFPTVGPPATKAACRMQRVPAAKF